MRSKKNVLTTASAAHVAELGSTAGVLKLNADVKVPVAQGFLTMFPRAIYAVTRASQVGFNKYGKWFKPADFAATNDPAILLDASVRHVLDEAIHGPVNVEKGGGLPAAGMEVRHAAQAAWEALARLELILLKEEQEKADAVKK